MAETSRPVSGTYSPASSAKPGGPRQRVIASCLTCRRRKVRCSREVPICGACSRGNHVCTYATDQGLGQTSVGRVSKSVASGIGKPAKNSDVQARLDRLELLLEKAVSGQTVPRPSSGVPSIEPERRETESQHTPSSNSQTSQTAGMSSDNQDGTLLVDGEQSQFVSSLHYALLADEIQDIKALLGDKTDEEKDKPTQNNLIHLLSLGRARIGITLEQLLPESQEHRDTLLGIYFSNVDPLIRITHKPTLLRKIPLYLRENHPIAFAIYYSAINSLPPNIVQDKFGDSRDELLARFELGVEICLSRENYLTTSSLEIFQGFILWLTCITKEEDMGKAWALLGIAIRIALNQGLHRDPSLFPSGSMDSITIESRRRIWHQICHLEFRAAECKGQEPSMSEDDYTTLLPRNIDDEELVEGASPGVGPYDENRFTGITFQLVRFVGMRALRQIVQSTYRLERRMLESGLHGTSKPDPAPELQTIYEQIKLIVNQMHEENQMKYVRHCSPQIAIQRLCLGLASLLEWRCYLIFWLRMPRAYRDIVFSEDVRKSIFENSVNCIETLNGASVDIDAARFQWHIGGHAAFQAIMHVLSELRNPSFDAPNREKALRALQTSRQLKENNNTKAWSAVKSMIDKVVAESDLPDANLIRKSASFVAQLSGAAPPPGPPSTLPINTPAPSNPPIFAEQMHTYNIPRPSQPLLPSDLSPQQQPQTFDTMQASQSVQLAQAEHSGFNWDDINFNNIVGSMDSTELPEFDFGYWGDPVNFGTEAVAFPMDSNVFGVWSG